MREESEREGHKMRGKERRKGMREKKSDLRRHKRREKEESKKRMGREMLRNIREEPDQEDSVQNDPQIPDVLMRLSSAEAVIRRRTED